MPWPLANTPLARVRAGLDWIVGRDGDAPGTSGLAGVVFDKPDVVDGDGLELGSSAGLAFCCAVTGAGVKRGDDTAV